MSTALDVSHWSGELTEARLRAAQRAGMTRLVVGTQNHAVARQQAGVARSLGVEVQAYVYLYFAANPAERVRRDLPLLREIGATRYWLDAEDVVAGMRQDAYVQDLHSAVAAAGAIPTGIYTARWWWVPYTGNSTAFAHLPLWTAQYDGKADLSAVMLYGGWKSAAMKQYRPHASHGDPKDGAWFPDQATGVWCDVNVYAAAVLTAEQRRLVDWLGTAEGRALSAATRAMVLANAGLTEAMVAGAGGTPPPPATTPAPTPSPVTPPATDRYDDGRRDGYREGYSAAASYLGPRVGLAVTQIASVRDEAARLAASPPARP